MTSIVADRLCGSIPITTALITTLPPDPSGFIAGRARAPATLSWRKPFLSLSLPKRHPARAGQMGATRPSAGSRCESDEPGA